MSGFFGGKDPLDHPFFTQPLGGLFGGRSPFDDPFFSLPFDDHRGSRKQIIIEGLNPDGDDGGNHVWQNYIPIQELSFESPGIQSFSFQGISYGGPNGPEYTAYVGRTGGDRVVLMEIKEEDKLAGESLHTISRGMHDKGHSVTKKKSSGGQVDSLQTLHNLNEDELAGFEENWRACADINLPGWNKGFNSIDGAGTSRSSLGDFANWVDWGGWPFPSFERYGVDEAMPNSGLNDFMNWGWGGSPFPSLEHHGYGGADEDGEVSQPSTHGTSRRVIPIE